MPENKMKFLLILAAVAAGVVLLRLILRPFPARVRKAVAFLEKTAFVTALFVFIFQPGLFGFRPDLFHNITPYSLWEQIKQIDPKRAAVWLTFAACVKLLGIFAGIIRWRILLRAQGVHIPFWYMTKSWFWGRAVGLFLPGTLGLDGYRLVDSSTYTGEVIKCTTVIVVEKLTGFIALFTLVFLTVPLGMRLFVFKPVVLIVVLAVLAAFIATCMLLLMQPRIIQVLVAVIPTPAVIRNKVNKIGAAVTTYSHRRGALLAAVFFGLCVHIGICMMYFGTMSAIRPPDTNILDILFASPLIIVGSVLTPTVSGMGVREVVMTTILGAKSGTERAFLFGHLGLWFGEVVPFILSIPLLLFTGRPNREHLLEDIAAVRKAAAHADAEDLHLSDAEVREYRKRVFGTLACALFGGLLAGGLIGLCEALWIARTLPGLTEMGLFTWGPVAYGAIFAGVGLGAGAVLLFFYLLFNRFARGAMTYALSAAGCLAFGGLVIGFFRLKRDILQEMDPTQEQLIQLLAYVGGAALVAFVAIYVISVLVARLTRHPVPLLAAGLAAFGLTVGAGGVLARQYQPEGAHAAFTPARPNGGPNIFLIAVDTLRADFLKLYNPAAPTGTPNIEAFARDAVLYKAGFSQASWTKASFGTIFSGMYPECHTAVTKTARLPQDVETVAELLQAGGYYTQGYSNNPNITSTFGYDQGFVEYVDLKPSLYFGASASAAKLSLYEVLRRVRQIADQKILRRKMVVTEFYQPAGTVTGLALDWADGPAVPEAVPFLLFLHYMDPHDPFMDPESPQGGYARVRMGDNVDPKLYREPMTRAYTKEIDLLDRELGRLFQGLKERGLYDNALIILTADHGEEFCEHGGWWHGKTLYDEQIHVPILVKLPGNARGGEVNPNFARNLDLAPTMLQFAGLPKGAMMQGEPLFDAAMNPANGQSGYNYAENNFEGIVLQSVRTLDKKIIKANEGNPRGLAPLEFYDVAADPGEQVNLAGTGQFADIEKQLLDAVDQYLQICEQGGVEPEAPSALSNDLQEQMDALGYLP